MKTTAQKIATRFHNHGQIFTDKFGKSIEDVCDGMAVTTEKEANWQKYIFKDDSIITIAGGGWDFGFSCCHGWQGAGHTLECEHA